MLELPKYTSAFLNLTQRCNLKCRYCFVKQQPKDMTLEVARDSVGWLLGNCDGDKKPSVNFFGGEPLLKYNEIIVPLVEEYGEKVNWSITTNGLLLDKDRLDWMKSKGFGFLLSIDGDKKTQDYNRPCHDGRSSFDILEPKLKTILETWPEITFRATLDRDTVGNLFENYLFAEEKGFKSATFILNVFEDWTDNDFEILKNQLYKIGQRIEDKASNGEAYCQFSQFPTIWGQVQSGKNKAWRSQGLGLPGAGRCGIGGTSCCGIGYSGQVYTCQEMVDNLGSELFCVGSIYDGVSDQARLEAIGDFDPWQVRSSKAGACETCVMSDTCTGGCNINNYFKYQDLHIQDYSLCKYNQLCFEVVDKVMKGKVK